MAKDEGYPPSRTTMNQVGTKITRYFIKIVVELLCIKDVINKRRMPREARRKKDEKKDLQAGYVLVFGDGRKEVLAPILYFR